MLVLPSGVYDPCCDWQAHVPNILLISVTSLFVKGPKVPAIGELSKQHSRQQKRKEIYAGKLI